MENKKKDQKPGFVCNQDSQINDEPRSKQDNAQANVSVGRSAKTSSPSPSHDSTPNPNRQQQPPIVQWPYTPQNATEQFLAMHFPTQASPPGALSQWQQLPHPQVFAQSASPFWQSHPPGGPSSTTQPLVPNMYYHYTFPGFPCKYATFSLHMARSWDPSSYMAQLYQMQHPYVYSVPGALSFSSATPRVPDCLASGESSFQRGIIRPHAKLSQKHHQLWEAQSVENVQLWSVINKLQAEVSDCKDRLKKLEDEISTLKQKAEVPTNKVIGTIPAGTAQPLKKRGRPKRSSTSVDASYESPHLRAGGRNPSLNNSPSQNKSPIFEKVILKKVGNKNIANRADATMVQRESNNVNILNGVKDVSCNNIQISQSNPIMSAYQGQVHQQPALCSNSGVNVNFGNTGNGNVGLTCGIPCQDTAKDVLHNGSLIRQGGNITPGWSLSFANKEDASGNMERSGKDENEVMEDDTISAAEEIGVTNLEVDLKVNGYGTKIETH
ncbi:hypothetical protein CR513_55565, partial [Mucuna pruriens]